MKNRCFLFALIILVFFSSCAAWAQSSAYSNEMEKIQKRHKKNLTYDIEHIDMNVTQGMETLDITARMTFTLTDPSGDTVVFFIANGCAVKDVQDAATGEPVAFEQEGNPFTEKLTLALSGARSGRLVWAFAYTCEDQFFMEDKPTSVDPEGVLIGGVWAWYPSNMFDEKFAFDITINTRDGFVAAANGALVSGAPGDTMWQYRGETDKLSLTIGRYSIVKETRHGVEYQVFYAGGLSPDLPVSRIFDILDYAITLFSDLYAPYPYDSFRVVGCPVKGFSCNFGRENSLFIQYSYLSNSTAQSFLGIIGHEGSHVWFGNLLKTDNDVFVGFIENLAETGHSLAFEYNPFDLPRYNAPRSWAYWYDEYVAEHSGGKGGGEISILKARSTVPGTVFHHYGKGAMVLRAFRRKVGDEMFFKTLRVFTQENLGKICSVQAFAGAAQEVAGDEAVTFLKFWYTGADHMDYALAGAVQSEAGGKYRTRLTIQNMAEVSLDAPMEILFQQEKDGAARNDIVEVELTGPVTEYEYVSDNKIVRVQLDPHFWNMDCNPKNNIIGQDAISWE